MGRGSRKNNTLCQLCITSLQGPWWSRLPWGLLCPTAWWRIRSMAPRTGVGAAPALPTWCKTVEDDGEAEAGQMYIVLLILEATTKSNNMLSHYTSCAATPPQGLKMAPVLPTTHSHLPTQRNNSTRKSFFSVFVFFFFYRLLFKKYIQCI